MDYEVQFSTDPVLNDKIKKNQLNKRKKKTTRVNRVKSLSTILESWDQDNLMKSKQNSSWSLILNQINIKGWNWKKK
jgi:hypothetical protein